MDLSVEKHPQAVRSMFSAIAGRYDLLNHLLSLNQDRGWRRRGVAAATVREGALALDVGAGTGDLAIEFARRHPQAGAIVAADFAAPMLEIARDKFRKESARIRSGGGCTPSRSLSGECNSPHKPAMECNSIANRDKFALAGADALNLPYADESFDVVMSAFTVRNFADTEAGLREMCRVTRRGGQLLILEFCKPTSRLYMQMFRLFFHHVLPRVGRVVSQHKSAYDYLPNSVEGFYTRGELERLLRVVGYGAVRSRDLTGGIATMFVATKSGQGVGWLGGEPRSATSPPNHPIIQ